MRIPGFTAESTVYRSKEHYRVDRYGSTVRGTVVPQGGDSGLKSICQLECRQICRNTCTRRPGSVACTRCRTTCLRECDSPVLR